MAAQGRGLRLSIEQWTSRTLSKLLMLIRQKLSKQMRQLSTQRLQRALPQALAQLIGLQ